LLSLLTAICKWLLSDVLAFLFQIMHLKDGDMFWGQGMLMQQKEFALMQKTVPGLKNSFIFFICRLVLNLRNCRSGWCWYSE